jgi:hypothetical protein
MIFGQPGWEPLTMAEFLRIRTTPAYRRAVRWLRITLVLLAFLPIDVLAWELFHQTDVSETIVTLVVFVSVFTEFRVIALMQKAGLFSWARAWAGLLGARFGYSPPPLMTRAIRKRWYRDILLPRQDYTLAGQYEILRETASSPVSGKTPRKLPNHRHLLLLLRRRRR